MHEMNVKRMDGWNGIYLYSPEIAQGWRLLAGGRFEYLDREALCTKRRAGHAVWLDVGLRL